MDHQDWEYSICKIKKIIQKVNLKSKQYVKSKEQKNEYSRRKVN